MATAKANLKAVETNVTDVAEFMRAQGAKAQEGANVRLVTCLEFGKKCHTKEWTADDAAKAARAYEEGYAAKAGIKLADSTSGPLESKLRAFANPAARDKLDAIVAAFDAAKATRSKKDMGDKDAFSGVYAAIARINKLAKDSKPIPELNEAFILEAVGAVQPQAVDETEEGKAKALEHANKVAVTKVQRALYDIAKQILDKDMKPLLTSEYADIASSIISAVGLTKPSLPKSL